MVHPVVGRRLSFSPQSGKLACWYYVATANQVGGTAACACCEPDLNHRSGRVGAFEKSAAEGSTSTVAVLEKRMSLPASSARISRLRT